MANEKIQIDIGAKDAASPVIEKLATKIDGLEADEARIIVSADTRKLVDQLDRARIKLGTLTGDEHSVQARLVGSLEADVANAKDLLDKLDGQTATVKIDTVGAKQGLDDINKSADSSKSALANMVGNSAQDVGNLAGATGSAGVLIGQMAEYMADASFEGEKFGSVLRSFAGVVGPAVALAAGIGALTNMLAESGAKAAASEARIKSFGKALDAAGEGADNLTEHLADNTEMLTDFDAAATDFGSGIVEGLGPLLRGVPLLGGVFGDMGKNITDLIPILNAAEISAGEFGNEIKVGVDVMSPFIGKLSEAVESGKITADQYAAVTEALRTYNAEVEAAKLVAGFFGEATSLVGVEVSKLTPSVEDLKDAQQTQADAAQNAADRADDLRDSFRDARRATDELKTANQQLRDDITNSQYLLDLKDVFREVEIAGDEAMQAAADGALDAGIKVDDYTSKVNDAKLKVLDYKDALGELPANKTTTIVTLLDEGQLAEAERRMEVLTRNRTMEISIVTKGGIGFPDSRLPGSRI